MNIDGTEYVTKAERDDVARQRDEFRRTLALAHAKLFERDPEGATRIIERDTGWTFRDAQAILGVIASAREHFAKQEPQGHDT